MPPDQLVDRSRGLPLPVLFAAILATHVPIARLAFLDLLRRHSLCSSATAASNHNGARFPLPLPLLTALGTGKVLAIAATTLRLTAAATRCGVWHGLCTFVN
jgi:hypothetical protein